MNATDISLETLTALILASLPSELEVQHQLEEISLGSSRMICGIWAEHCKLRDGGSYWLLRKDGAAGPAPGAEHALPAAQLLRELAFQAELVIALQDRAQYVRDLLDPII